jgi:spore maturation protein CgeB
MRIFYDLDTPVTLDMLDRGESAPWLPSDGLGQFDLVLSYTGGAALDALATRLGARRVAPLYGSVDVSAHHPVGGHPEWTLSYLATYAPDRQDGVQRLFLDVAERMPSGRFILGGPMYPAEMRWPPNLTYEPHVAPGEHPMFYGASRFTLNLTRGAMKKLGYCPSGRLFEAAACGVPIVSDAWEGLGQFFEPGREIIVANTADDVLRAIASPPDELSRMAHRARERTLAQHTARHRAIELLSLVQSNTVRSAEKP